MEIVSEQRKQEIAAKFHDLSQEMAPAEAARVLSESYGVTVEEILKWAKS